MQRTTACRLLLYRRLAVLFSFCMLACLLGPVPAAPAAANAEAYPVYNGDFETAPSGDPAPREIAPGWEQTIGAGGISLSAAAVYEGAFSLLIESGSTNANLGVESVFIPVVAGDSYTVQAMTYVEQGTGKLYARFYDAGRSLVGQTSASVKTIGEWVRLASTFTVPDGAAYVRILLYKDKIVPTRAYYDHVTLTQSTVPPQEDGVTTLLGTPLQDITLPYAAYGNGPNGERWIYMIANGTSESILSVIDVDTGAKIKEIPLPNSSVSWGSVAAPNGDVYIGTQKKGFLYRYVPGSDVVESLGVALPNETHLWGIVFDEEGRIYGGTYPGGKVFQYDPVSRQYTDYGQMAAGQNYVRSIAYGNGKVYAGTGVSNAQVIELDPVTAVKRPIPLPENYRNHHFVYDMGFGGDLLFVRLTHDATHPLNNVTLIYDTVAEEWIEEIDKTIGLGYSPVGPDDRVYFIQDGYLAYYDVVQRQLGQTGLRRGGTASRGFGWYEMGAPDFPGLSLVSATGSGSYFIYNPQTGSSKQLQGYPAGAAAPVRSIGVGQDGNLYVGGYLAGVLAKYDTGSGRWSTMDGTSQIESITAHAGKLYLGVYPNAYLHMYDLAKPWDGGRTNPVKQQMVPLVAEQQDRPFAIAPIGERLLAVGTVPVAGQLGGALSLYDPQTGEAEVFRHIVSNQSPVALVHREGLIYGGTTVWGGISKEPVEQEGKLFIFDPATKRKLFETAPVAGEKAVTALTFDGEGMLWGLTNGVLFKFDPVERNVIRTIKLYDFEWKDTTWAAAFMNFYEDGYLYGLAAGNVFRFDPVTWEHTTIMSKAKYFAQDEFGTIYTSLDTSAIYSYDRFPPKFQHSVLLADNRTATGASLTWTPTRDMKSFRLYRDGAELAREGFVYNEDGTVTYLATGLTPNTAYTFKVEAQDAAGLWSEDGPSVTVNTGNAANAAGKPGKPVLSDDNGHMTGIQGGAYKISMNMWWGNNGTAYRLYENDVLLETANLVDNTPNGQSAETLVQGRPNGTYRYYAELTNAFGTTRSDVLTVTVSQASPAQPVLSPNNWDGDGSFQVSMNMWWGTNGAIYRLYENGKLIDTQRLNVQTPQAQSAVTSIAERPVGVYEYRGELENDAGVTSSQKLIVHVVK